MLTKKVLALLCLGLAPTVAPATTVLLSPNEWTEFRFDADQFGGEFLEATGSAPGILSFAVDLAERSVLQVTDAFLSGDRFELFVDGVSIGQTSAPTTVNDDIGGDFEAAFLDPRFSSGSFFLNPGTFTLTGFVTEQPIERGRGALRIVAAPAVVPLPGSFGLLLGAGAVGVFAASRKTKKTKGLSS